MSVSYTDNMSILTLTKETALSRFQKHHTGSLQGSNNCFDVSSPMNKLDFDY